jgi:hypothetical protein
MSKAPKGNAKLLRDLNLQIKVLQEKLVEVHKIEGKDAYIDVKVKKSQGRGEKIKKSNNETVATGKFFMQIDIKAKQENVFIPLSIASGKKVAGFMYQVESTSVGSVSHTEIRVRGEGVTLVSVGTLRYAKILPNSTATFEIRVTINGESSESYRIVFTRLNYKVKLTDLRYQQYLKEVHSENIKL